jgi:uncharacterized protein DUF3179
MKLALAATLLCVVLIVAPLLVALPPVRQTPAMLAAARAAGALAPFLSAVAAILAAWRLWRARTWRAAAVLCLAALCAVLSRIHLLEWVFAGARGAETASMAAFHDIRDSDMVLGVVIEGRSRAYPVRYLAYHHMLNDRLGSTALLPTY